MAAAAAATAAPLVLVTGASGYIAVHITGILLKAGWRVRGTVRNPDDALKTAPLRSLPGAADRLELVKADLLQPAEDWKPIVAGCDYVLHTASPFPLAAPKHKSELIEPAVQGECASVWPGWWLPARRGRLRPRAWVGKQAGCRTAVCRKAACRKAACRKADCRKAGSLSESWLAGCRKAGWQGVGKLADCRKAGRVSESWPTVGKLAGCLEGDDGVCRN